MVYLILSVLCSVSVSILLKYVRTKNIGLKQIVGVNYIIACVLCALLLNPTFNNWHETILPDLWVFGLLGMLLPTIFVIMGKAEQNAGIVKADAAQRLSLFIPVLAAFTLFGEAIKINHVIGLVLAFTALACILKKNVTHNFQPTTNLDIRYLLGVWLGYGVIDILFKQLSKLNGTGSNLLIVFSLAGLITWSYLLIKRVCVTRQDITFGIILGCLNFCNILFYIQAHKSYSNTPTLVFAGMNMGVIVLGTLMGAAIFKEKISLINAFGLVLALLALTCLYFWDKLIWLIGS